MRYSITQIKNKNKLIFCPDFRRAENLITIDFFLMIIAFVILPRLMKHTSNLSYEEEVKTLLQKNKASSNEINEYLLQVQNALKILRQP